MKECVKRFLVGRVHRFVPRYSIVAPEWFKQLDDISGNVSELYEKHYVHDVCIYCGETTKGEQ